MKSFFYCFRLSDEGINHILYSIQVHESEIFYSRKLNQLSSLKFGMPNRNARKRNSTIKFSIVSVTSIRCKNTEKNCQFQFDSSQIIWQKYSHDKLSVCFTSSTLKWLNAIYFLLNRLSPVSSVYRFRCVGFVLCSSNYQCAERKRVTKSNQRKPLQSISTFHS